MEKGNRQERSPSLNNLSRIDKELIKNINSFIKRARNIIDSFEIFEPVVNDSLIEEAKKRVPKEPKDKMEKEIDQYHRRQNASIIRNGVAAIENIQESGKSFLVTTSERTNELAEEKLNTPAVRETFEYHDGIAWCRVDILICIILILGGMISAGAGCYNIGTFFFSRIFISSFVPSALASLIFPLSSLPSHLMYDHSNTLVQKRWKRILCILFFLLLLSFLALFSIINAEDYFNNNISLFQESDPRPYLHYFRVLYFFSVLGLEYCIAFTCFTFAIELMRRHEKNIPLIIPNRNKRHEELSLTINTHAQNVNQIKNIITETETIKRNYEEQIESVCQEAIRRFRALV